MTTYLPVLVAAAALVLTYLFCIRPMQSGHCARQPAARQDDPRRERELELARTELELLQRRQHRAGGARAGGTGPDTEAVVRHP